MGGHPGERVLFTCVGREKCKTASDTPTQIINNPYTTLTTNMSSQPMATHITQQYQRNNHNLLSSKMAFINPMMRDRQVRRGNSLTFQRSRAQPRDQYHRLGRRSQWKDPPPLLKEDVENHHAPIRYPSNCNLKPTSDRLVLQGNSSCP